MSTTQNDLLKLQNGTEETHTPRDNSPSELVERHRVPDTGFDIIGNKEKGYFVALGIYRITEPKQTIKECEQMIKQKNYEIILGLISASIIMNNKELKPQIEKILADNHQ